MRAKCTDQNSSKRIKTLFTGRKVERDFAHILKMSRYVIVCDDIIMSAHYLVWN